MSEAKPRALELADELQKPWLTQEIGTKDRACAELRLLHSDLVAAHEAIVALSEALEEAEKALRVVTATLMLPKKHAAALNLVRATYAKHGVKQ